MQANPKGGKWPPTSPIFRLPYLSSTNSEGNNKSMSITIVFTMNLKIYIIKKPINSNILPDISL